MANEDNYNIRSLERALKIFEIFIEKNRPLTLKEISDYSNNSNTSVLRILRTLQKAKFMSCDESTKKYFPSYKFFILGMCVNTISELTRICKPYLKELVHKVGLTSHLAVMENGQVIIIDKVMPEGKESINMISKVGYTVPAYCTSVGKVLLSRLKNEEIKNLYKDKMIKFTEHTITDIDELVETISMTRRSGYAVTENEHEKFIKCIAYPIRNNNNEIICAISLTGIDKEFESIKNEICHNELYNTANIISLHLNK